MNVSNRRGAILILVAVALVAVVGLLVLVIDHGDIQQLKRKAQAAADAGARAGANEMYRNQTSEIIPAATKEATRNGFTDGVDTTVRVFAPPVTSVNSPGTSHVRVEVEVTNPTFFASIFGFTSSRIRAAAVAGVGSANTACLTLTEPDSVAVSVKSGFLTAVDCSIFVNSTWPSAVEIPAQGAITAQSVAVVGGPTSPPGGLVGSYSSGAPLPPYGTDPMSSLTMPAVGACNGAYGAYSDFNGTALSPGVYCGGIGITHGGTVTFAPGLYILAGGGLYLKGATIIGNGVTFVNTNAPAADGGATNYGVRDPPASQPNTAIEIEVNTVINLSAMTTGSLAGVLFYADPAAGLPGVTYTNYLYSSSTTSLLGSMYFPNEALQAKSNSDLTINGAVVVKSVAITTGQQTITIKGPSSGSGYYGLLYPTIVE